VGEVQGERRLRGSIPRLTAIDDGVSLAVKEHYEESPYPRWIKASPVVQTTIEAHLRAAAPDSIRSRPRDSSQVRACWPSI